MGNTKRNRRKSKIMRSSKSNRTLTNENMNGSQNFSAELSSSLEFPPKSGIDHMVDPEDGRNRADQRDQSLPNNQDEHFRDQNSDKRIQMKIDREAPTNYDQTTSPKVNSVTQNQVAKRGVKQPRKKNELFQDVDKTGSWGKLSITEIIVGVVILLAVVGGIIAAVIIFAGKKKGNELGNDSLSVISKSPSAAPSMHPKIDAAVQLPVILDALETINVSTTYISSDFFFYEPSFVLDPNRLPRVRAISWILNEDPRDSPPEDPALISRFALADIYFSLKGESWINNNNWLSGENACEWHGVSCDPTQSSIHELDLSKNNVSGTITPSFGLLSDLRSLILSNNNISGTIPSGTLGNMPDLSILYLNDNRLSGDLFLLGDLITNNVLQTFIIHENNITGRWPRNFCPRAGEDPVFRQFTLDCTDMTRCLCCTVDNCF